VRPVVLNHGDGRPHVLFAASVSSAKVFFFIYLFYDSGRYEFSEYSVMCMVQVSTTSFERCYSEKKSNFMDTQS